MDILISSNLERLLFELTGHDDVRISQWMRELQQNGYYEVDKQTLNQVQELFWADYSSDAETKLSINKTWNEEHYLLDTHTAVAMDVYRKYQMATGDDRAAIIASTASPFKFGKSVAEAILAPEIIKGKSEFETLRILADAAELQIPEGIRNLEDKKIRHSAVTAPEEMENTVRLLLDN